MRVCPFCGEPPGPGVFCEACGRNLAGVEQLPSREEWKGSDPEPAATVSVDAFLAAMHAAGDPGSTEVRLAEPGFLGRKRHATGWVVRAVERGPDPKAPYEPGLFITVEGTLHRLDSAVRGMQRDEVRYVDILGPEVAEAPHADELGAVLRAAGHPAS